MTEDACKCRALLVFPSDFDSRAEYEAKERGLLDYVKVYVNDAGPYDVCFFTPARIQLEFELLEKVGQSWFAEPGLILVPTITRDAMQAAVEALMATDYFDKRVPSV